MGTGKMSHHIISVCILTAMSLVQKNLKFDHQHILTMRNSNHTHTLFYFSLDLIKPDFYTHVIHIDICKTPSSAMAHVFHMCGGHVTQHSHGNLSCSCINVMHFEQLLQALPVAIPTLLA